MVVYLEASFAFEEFSIMVNNISIYDASNFKLYAQSIWNFVSIFKNYNARWHSGQGIIIIFDEYQFDKQHAFLLSLCSSYLHRVVFEILTGNWD